MNNDLIGIYPAFVCNIKDDEKRGRIKVTCSEVFGDVSTESAWCDPCVPVAFDEGGDICVPKLGEGVWIAFVEGDIDRPVYLGGWWQKKQTLLKPKTYNEEAGSVRYINYGDCFILMSGGVLTIYTKDTKNAIVVGNNKVVMNCDVEISGNLTVNGNSNVTGTETVVGNANIGGKSFLGHTHIGNEGAPTSAPI